MEDKKKKLIIGIIIVIGLLVLFKDNVFSFIQKEENNNNTEIISEVEIKSEVEMVYVQISGEIMYPDLYTVPSSMLLYDLLKLAGLKDTADISQLNLAEKIIPSHHYKINSVNNSVITNSNQNVSSNQTNSKININTATKAQLMSLSGIGEVLATRIIEYRASTSFRTIEDIMNVTGIKEKVFEQIKDSITI